MRRKKRKTGWQSVETNTHWHKMGLRKGKPKRTRSLIFVPPGPDVPRPGRGKCCTRRPRPQKGQGIIKKIVMVLLCAASVTASGCSIHEACTIGGDALSRLHKWVTKPCRRSSPKKRRAPSHIQPAVVRHQPSQWKNHLHKGMVAYQEFRYHDSKRELSRVIDDPHASLSARAAAYVFRAAASFLLGDDNQARRDYLSARRLGGEIDPDIFPANMVEFFRRSRSSS